VKNSASGGNRRRFVDPICNRDYQNRRPIHGLAFNTFFRMLLTGRGNIDRTPLTTAASIWDIRSASGLRMLTSLGGLAGLAGLDAPGAYSRASFSEFCMAEANPRSSNPGALMPRPCFR